MSAPSPAPIPTNEEPAQMKPQGTMGPTPNGNKPPDTTTPDAPIAPPAVPKPPSQPTETPSLQPKPKPKAINRTPLPPPPISAFSKSRPTRPSPKLSTTVQPRNKFSFIAKPTTKNSRTAFLTAALSPSFVSAKPLHTRTHTTISEIVGNLAPERYLSLPPRSPPAAKALLATSVCKELRDVHKLETIRKRHGDVETGGWFDYVLDSLGDGTKLRVFSEKMKKLTIPPWHGIVDRVAFLPLECLNIDSVMGQDFSAMVNKKPDNLRMSKSRPIEPPEVRISRMKNAIKAQIARNNRRSDKKPMSSAQGKPLPVVDTLMDVDDLQPPLPARDTASVTHTPKTTTADPAVASAPPNVQSDIVMIDDDTPAQSSADIPTPKPRVQLPVFLVFDDTTGKVSIDWEIREIPAKQSPPTRPAAVMPQPAGKPSSANTTASKKRNALPRKGLPPSERTTTPTPVPTPNVQVQAPTKAVPVSPRVRPVGGPSKGLETLLTELDDDIVPPLQPDKTPGSDPEIVVVDGAKEAPAPKPTQRRTKRKRVDRAQERAVETEQRASRMRSAVVSALQEDPETRRQRRARSSTANGHAKPKKKVSFTGHRMSRRSKKNSAPILDSSGSEKEYRRDEDDDFNIDAEDVVEVLPVPKTNDTRAPAPDLSPAMQRPPPPSLGREPPCGLTEIESLDGSDMISPQMRPADLRTARPTARKVARSGASKHVRLHKSGASSSRRHRLVDEETHEGEPELWSRELLQVQRLIEENEQDIDPLLNEIEYNRYRFYEQVPIMRRVIKAAKAQHGHLMDMDKVDEYEEMDQFYNETRSDPPFGSGTGCPGTEFLEYIFHQTERERRNAMTGCAGDPPNSTIDILDEDGLDIQMPTKRTVGGVVNLTNAAGHPSSPSRGSSDSSADSSGEDDDMYAGGSKRSRSHARSRASKARELQSRVCGDLLATMTNEAKRRVLRWAERDFAWFDRGVDVMEIVASRAYKRCSRCDAGEREEEKCEESILLKLWKDMSWRKVRRMRHRSSGTT